MEYGISKSLLIYFGGFGIFVGDYVKIVSDFGFFFIVIGFFYKYGYFR